MPRAPTPPFLRAPRRTPGRVRLGVGLLVAAWLLGVAGRVAAAPDLTELSLEQLMDVELPPLATTARFQVSATAVDSCVVRASDLAFGNYDALQPSPTDASSVISVTCTVGSGYTIALDAGTGTGATVAARKLTGEGDALGYALYRDAGRALLWGDTPGTDTVDGVGTGAPESHVVYGRIPPGQVVRRGFYTDTITVSVTY